MARRGAGSSTPYVIVRTDVFPSLSAGEFIEQEAGGSICFPFPYKSSKEKPDVFFLMRQKPLFHEVQQEMLAIVKSQAFWPYIGLRASGLIAKGGMVLACSMLLCYIILGLVMQRTTNVGPDETKKLAEAIVPYVMGFMGAGIVAGFFYDHLWDRLQPVVRAAARGIQG